jgi:hypothetical protein
MANMLKTATMTLFFIGLLLIIIYSEKDGKDTLFLDVVKDTNLLSLQRDLEYKTKRMFNVEVKSE